MQDFYLDEEKKSASLLLIPEASLQTAFPRSEVEMDCAMYCEFP